MKNTLHIAKHSFVLLFTLLFALITTSFFLEANGTLVNAINLPTEDILEFEGTFDWETPLSTPSSSTDYITYTQFRTNVCKYTTADATTCQTNLAGRTIRFDTAEELYWFSVDVSFEEVYSTGVPAEDHKLSDSKIEFILAQHYVLGKNIDYSIMQSKAFIPIGYAFNDVEQTVYERSFTGILDGQGFAISHLYVAGYDHLVYVDNVDEVTTIDIALSEHYSMFNYNEGTIENLGLIDPNLEILDLHIDITKLSNLVGFNMAGGVVQNVYVIDTRTTTTTAGMRYQVGTSSEDFQAAGIMHTNQGTFQNAYYVSLVVINGNYINKFHVQPVLYSNSGTIGHLVYDSERYLYPTVVVGSSTFIIDLPNGYATGETTNTLKSTSSTLNQVADLWYFYPSDGYPLLQGFEYDDIEHVYYIDTPVQLAFFSRVIAFLSVKNGTTFAAADYVITSDLDMSTLAPNAYGVPTATFTGTLSGLNPEAADLSENYYIYNLNLSVNIIRGTEYYAGLFSILGAGSEVSNLNFSASTVSFTNTDLNYSYTFYIGAIAGKMLGGTISNVLLDVDINLGTQAIGKTYAGGLVGKASGIIENVSSNGDMTSGNHVFNSSYSIKPVYNIGGVIGGAELGKLTVQDVVNHGTIYGFQTASAITLATGYTSVEVRTGGVIGYVNNTVNNINELINVANFGDIYLANIIYSVGVPSYHYVGGVFGKQGGLAPIIEANDEYKFANLYNEGDIYKTYVANTAVVRAAGIGVNNTTEAVEYALLFNHGTFNYTEGAATYTQTQFKFVALIFDISSYGVTISRAYNYADLNYDSNIYYDISALYYSLNNNATTLRYVANYGNLNYYISSGSTQMTLATNVYITGITRNTNVNYLNVYNYGTINVVNVNTSTYTLYVAGITTQLTSGKYIKNSLNDGDIHVAKIAGSGNIYIGGIVNTNLSGDLQDPGQSPTQPVATIGIINTINSGEINTSYGLEAQNLYGINGTNNTFIGGITTLNKGSIQDAANLGDIKAYNSYASSSFSYETDTTYAGLIISYNSGIAAGGIAAAVIGGTSRIYDTANNGDVLVTANKYVRAGGILGTSLYREATGGGITTGMGLSDDIQSSVLSNGLNFGNISALSNTIATYSTSTTNQTFTLTNDGGVTGPSVTVSTVTGNEERPPIYSSAGGVIGYGLSIMQRMLNHGTISATDVAGGVVGATYVLGSVTTVVNITTAINYGAVKSVANTNVSSINKYSMSYSNISSYYMADGNTFIFPSGYSKEAPGTKRGFGGIFGRLQRGLSGIMTSAGGAFDFIVNANEHVDLIGRLDQVHNFSSSSRYFRFNDGIFYSAKLNDTTQNVFTGFRIGTAGTIASYTGSSRNWDITANYYTYFEQVGIVATYLYNQSTTYPGTYHSTSRNTPIIGATTTTTAYLGGLMVPWITEDPSDPNITNSDEEYMYDADFPMRTDPDLTEYIYFMANDLLAPRFTTERPNGMYVLSTSAGQSYGSVLPKNIDMSYIRMIDEDYSGFISLFMDYTLVSPVLKTYLDSTIEDAYDDLKQTTFNDKAELIPNDSVFVTIDEDDGSNTTLTQPEVDYINKTVTFSISMEAFDSEQTTATYSITNALISSNALIAVRVYDYYGYTPSQAELEAFRELLVPEKNNVISTSYPAELSVTLPSHEITSNVTLSIGFFTIYSEAFIGDDLYAHDTYYNEYEVFIEFTPTLGQLPGNTQIETVQFNGGGTVAASGTTDVRSLGTVNYLGSITLNFEDTKGVFTQGYDFKNYFVIKYYDGTQVGTSYYSVSSSPVNIISGTGYYSITFTFTNVTKMGDYYFEYRYFPTSTLYTCYFDKGASSASALTDFTYYSEDDSISFNSFVITSYLNLGYDIEDFMDTGTNNFSSSTNTGLPSYVSNVTYNIDFMTSGSLIISPFAEIISARLVSVTITDGYKTYQMEYIVQAEDGSSQSVYTHNLIERTVDLTSVLKDGNDTEITDVFTTREAALTEFMIDLGFDQELNLYVIEPGAYSYLEISVTGTTNDELTTYTPEQIVGITYDVNDYLYIFMTYETLPGIYTFSFIYYRDGSPTDYVTFETDLVITKFLGSNSYLTDIKFSELANETTYPDINLTNEYGVIQSTPYNPAVYFEGIDYDGSDEAEWPYFKIDGRVSNVPLDAYTPYFLDYLPYGATISRYAYDPNTTSWYWTPEADANSSGEILGQLETDYTIFPDTGLEPGDGEEVMIQFRVTAEDGITQVYYFITVTDVTYNLSIVFDIYYCTDETQGSCTLASESVDFSDELVIITIKNMQTDGDDSVFDVDDPDDFPSFTTVYGLNNRMTQFYYTSDSAYTYKFGRNMAGFYTFAVELPLDQYLNNLYTYEIEFGEYYLNDASNYVSGLTGKYFYIEYATSIRTRRFNVYIRPIETPSTDAPFGLFEFFKSWFE